MSSELPKIVSVLVLLVVSVEVSAVPVASVVPVVSLVSVLVSVPVVVVVVVESSGI